AGQLTRLFLRRVSHRPDRLRQLTQPFRWSQVHGSELELAMKQSAVDVGWCRADNDYGFGLIDVVAACDLLSGGVTCTDADGDKYFAETG
ncbi:MAG: hypothetical protein JSV16_07335, partial [Candidatus Hydrogenedentota bacterium]